MENDKVTGQGQINASNQKVKVKFHHVRTLTVVAVLPTVRAWLTLPCRLSSSCPMSVNVELAYSEGYLFLFLSFQALQ